jgi:hypothetical protein
LKYFELVLVISNFIAYIKVEFNRGGEHEWDNPVAIRDHQNRLRVMPAKPRKINIKYRETRERAMKARRSKVDGRGAGSDAGLS